MRPRVPTARKQRASRPRSQGRQERVSVQSRLNAVYRAPLCPGILQVFPDPMPVAARGAGCGQSVPVARNLDRVWRTAKWRTVFRIVRRGAAR